MTRVSTELSLINKHVRQHNRETESEPVVWFEFLSFGMGSEYDDVYDEGGYGPLTGRNYAGGILVPTTYIAENEDSFVANEDGRQVLQNIHLTVLFKDAVNAGITDAAEYQRHLNDIIFYDGRYYKINDYRVWGRLPTEVLIGVSGFEVYVDQEFAFDAGPPGPIHQSLPWPPTFPSLV